ncbi:MAG: flagellar biosynthetic protein FliR [Armatimonadota bacterium]
MNLFHPTTSQIVGLLLIFVRIIAICFTAPVLSSPRVPLHLRAGIGIVLTLLLQPVVAPSGLEVGNSWTVFGVLLIKEVLAGLVIGYSASLILGIVQMVGEIQDKQAGFGFAGVVDPNATSGAAILGQFQMVLMWLVFFAVNGHHVLMQGIAESFFAVPLGSFTYTGGLTTHMVGTVTTLIMVALKISAPVVGSVLLADLALGMLQRTAPQLNIIAVGLQMKIAIALLVISLSLPFTVAVDRNLVSTMSRSMHEVMALSR